MCGITGMISSRNVCPQLFKSMQSLEYRGYDSAGMAVVCDGELVVRKDAGKIADVEQQQQLSSMHGHAGIAHTRWATHGEVNQRNSHPHVSSDQRFAIVHNGIIENYRSLRAELQNQGYVFHSETDSEAIVHLIAALHAQGTSIEEAFVAATKRLQGAFAFAMLTSHAPNTLFCARNESPLVIGVGDDALFLASDTNAFAPYTHQVVYLHDGEYALLHPESYTVKSLTTAAAQARQPVTIQWDAGQGADKGHYPHFMLKEIHEGADCIETALALPSDDIVSFAARIASSRRVFLTGVGTAYYVTLITQYYFAALTGRYLPVISADELPMLAQIEPGDLTIAVSQSGETYDTLKALRYTKFQGGQTMAVVNAPGSSMVREVDQAILQGAGPEICVLSTKSIISQVAILLRVALELGKQSGTLSEARYAAHLQDMTALPETLRHMYTALVPTVRRVGRMYCHIANWFFIGRGIYSAVALESALKFKEVSYLHAEGMSGGFLKHGTIALIDEDTHSLAFIPNAEEPALFNSTLTNIQEIRARGGLVIGVHDHKDESLRPSLDDEIVVPPTPALMTPFIHLTVGQMLSYHTALTLGRNIDKPRALAKSVTVA